jgi:hypothetical protein
MGDTFGGEHHRPSNPQRGRTMRQLQDQASYDNEPQLGCGAIFFVLVCAIAAVLGAVFT